ncbi:MAG TPA: hypothetical protein VFO59_02760 [Dehalococcoidia bacterium]|nr:hypothetical protein [Dehalococcoidia bacterium]
MRWPLDLAIALTRFWAAVYTRGLPPDVRAERREELACDLWHQQRPASLGREPAIGTAVEILARCLVGIPADITWRLETGASARSKGTKPMNNTLPMRIGFLAALLPLALLTLMGASFTLGKGDWDNTTAHWLWRSAFVACPIIGGFGLWLCATRPRLGMVLVVVGVGASAFLMPWMAFITAPIGLVIVAFAIKRSRGATGTGAGPAGPAGSSRWKQLLAVLGLSIVTLVGTALYAFSLEEWGDTRTVIFNLVGLAAVTALIYASALLLSDLRKGSGRRQTA